MAFGEDLLIKREIDVTVACGGSEGPIIEPGDPDPTPNDDSGPAIGSGDAGPTEECLRAQLALERQAEYVEKQREQRDKLCPNVFV